MRNAAFDRKLVAYTAGAAAVAGFAAAPSADAAVVVTPGPIPLGVDGVIDIDFDQSAATDRDFAVAHERTNGDALADRIILKENQNGGNGEAYVALNGQPAALAAGDPIGPGQAYDGLFLSNVGNRLVDEVTGLGNFTADDVTGNPQYLGVRFRVGDTGDEYFGWIGVDITDAENKTGFVTGYGYENQAGVAIAAGAVPEPAGLALLALGSAGLLARRRTPVA